MTASDPPATPTRVDITVAGHTVSIEASASLADVAAMAYALFRRTSDAACRMPVGFSATSLITERAAPAEEVDDEWMDGQQPAP